MVKKQDITFYILNQHNEIVTTLDTDTTGDHVPVLSAEVEGKLNSYDILTITIPADRDGVEVIEEDFTLIFEDITGWREYVIIEVEDADADTSLRTITCELSSTELLDEVVEANVPAELTDPAYTLYEVLRGTRWEVGIVDTSIYSQSFTDEIKYKPVLEAIDSLSRNYNCEVHFTYDIQNSKIARRFVNLYKRFGRQVGKRFEVGKDVTSVTRTVDTSTIKTAIIPYSTPATDEEGNEGDRLDITNVEWVKANGDPTDKPLGQNYIVDPEALAKYGRRDGDTIRNRFIAMEMDTASTSTLISMGWVQLGRYTKPKVTYELDVIDLWALTGDDDLKHENVYLGDTVIIIDDNFANPLTVTTRVVELNRDLLDAANNKVVLGESKTYFKARETEDQIEEVSNKVDKTASDLSAQIKDITDGTNYWQVNNDMGGTPNMLAGSSANDISSSNKGSTVGGGGDLGGLSNTIYGDFSTISGGVNNKIYYSTGFIGGGDSNNLYADMGLIAAGKSNNVYGNYAGILTGENNRLSAAYTAILTGRDNNISSDFGLIIGGEGNKVTGDRSLVLSGSNNSAGGSDTLVGTGINNLTTGIRTTVLNGQNNEANALHATVLNGSNNRVSNDNASVLAGKNNTANGQSSSVLSGENNQSNAAFSSSLGRGATANYEGAVAHASGRFDGSGAAQTQKVMLSRKTTDATPTVLGIGNSDDTIQRTAGNLAVMDLEYTVLAQNENGVAKAWKLAVTVADLGSGLTLLRTPELSVLGQSVSADMWGIEFKIVQDTTYGFDVRQAVLEVTGGTETIYWTGNVLLTELVPATGIGIDDEVVL